MQRAKKRARSYLRESSNTYDGARAHARSAIIIEHYRRPHFRTFLVLTVQRHLQQNFPKIGLVEAGIFS